MQERSVPVLVLSAGIADIIEEVFRQKLHRSFENIRVVSNRMVFYEKGHLVADKGLFMPVSKFMYKSASAKNWLSCWHFQHLITWKNEPPWDMAAPIQDRLKASNGLTRHRLAHLGLRLEVSLLWDRGMVEDMNLWPCLQQWETHKVRRTMSLISSHSFGLWLPAISQVYLVLLKCKWRSILKLRSFKCIRVQQESMNPNFEVPRYLSLIQVEWIGGPVPSSSPACRWHFAKP
ncbi:YABBY protein [Musa troglodytarum]|uniref:5'-nucleotidase n=1 Tax=Musa troglodytarum TaxID=320322 RepID=A0A9E7GLX6_9LILI|nr:YABBY protein [Musa troglodytarum]